MKYRWIVKEVEKDVVENLNKSLSLGRAFCAILATRGIADAKEAENFLQPKWQHLHNPYLFYEMKQAVSRIKKAIQSQEKIFLYGDYDVDGVTSTSLLFQCLKLLKANVEFYIPDRLKEGYGMHISAIQYLHQKQANLIITVDCGISSCREIEEANRLGIDVVVTDHHEVDEEIPKAYAIVNPKDPRGSYPFKGIAGVGVAFKVAWALCQEFSEDAQKVAPELREFLLDSMALVALGTISDVAPLTDENRIMARYGLLALENTKSIGLKSLKSIANINQLKPITSEHIGFRLGPRINAMGRLENSFESVELLTTHSVEKAEILAKKMELQNQKRKSLQDKIYQQAKQYIEKNNLKDKKVLILAEENWHPGVVGIVANRLLEEYYRPVLMIALSNGEGRGSARSIPGFHLFQALQSGCRHLIAYGGHEMAAGFKIKKEEIPNLDEYLNQRALDLLKPENMQPSINIDAQVYLEEIDWTLINLIEKIAPFGEGNPEPWLLCKNLEIIKNPAPERYGTKGDHLSFRVRSGEKVFRTIAFGEGKKYDELMSHTHCDIVFRAKRNVWNNTEYIQLNIKDMNIY